MAQISGSTATDVFNNLSIGSKTAGQDKSNELGKNDFMQLMIAQMENQDPLSPQENGEFIVQMAQFSELEGIENLNKSMADVAASMRSNQALQASALVGRTVLTESDSVLMGSEGGVSGSVELPQSVKELQVGVYDETGGLVKMLDMSEYQSSGGLYPSGELPVKWDGTNAEGERVQPGNYQFKAVGSVGGEGMALTTNIHTNVNSVSIGQSGDITLKLAGVGSVALADIKQFF